MSIPHHVLSHDALLRCAGALHHVPAVGVIRRLSRGVYTVYVEDAALTARLLRWRGCTLRATYVTPLLQPLGWELRLPARLTPHVAKLCTACRPRVAPAHRRLALVCCQVRMAKSGWRA